MSHMKHNLSLCLLWIGILIGIAGCNTDLSKTVRETDADVYKIIDETWHDGIGDRQIIGRRVGSDLLELPDIRLVFFRAGH